MKSVRLPSRRSERNGRFLFGISLGGLLSDAEVFGTLLYAGKDWADPALGRRPMILAAEQVMPRVNAAIETRSAA